jgi:translation initiation factor 2 beta subunit (eIF-2beta)/eIF-5
MLHQHNPELAGDKRKLMIAPPQIAREGTKKTMFGNLTEICRKMHRQPEHVITFLYAELGTTGSLDGNQRLLMKGRFTQKQIENVLRKYIGESSPQNRRGYTDEEAEYVTCKICKSPDTILGKENRLYFMTCEACASREPSFSNPLVFANVSRSVGRAHQGWLPSSNRKTSQACCLVYHCMIVFCIAHSILCMYIVAI